MIVFDYKYVLKSVGEEFNKANQQRGERERESETERRRRKEREI
jgi:hypothetical protein